MRKFRVFTAVLAVILAATTLFGCGANRRSDHGDPHAGEVRIKGQVDGGVGSSHGLGGKSD